MSPNCAARTAPVEYVQYEHETFERDADSLVDYVSESPSDDEHVVTRPAASVASASRDEECGAFSYHHGTESALLAHVRNAIDDEASRSGTTSSSGAAASAAVVVLDAVDDFCRTKHWMMHVGPEKGSILREALHRSAEEFRATCNESSSRACSSPVGKRSSFVCVELGTYCGYAAIVLGKTLQAAQARADADVGGGRDGVEFRLYTVEVNPEHARVAREMIRLAGLADFVSVIDIPECVNIIHTEDAAADAISKAIREEEAKYIGNDHAAKSLHLPQIDFLFMDHDKDMYLPDLQRLEREGLVRAGTTVVADNVIFARIEDYLSYITSLAEESIVVTRTVDVSLEYMYSDDDEDDADSLDDGALDLFDDGMEVTKYLRSPLANDDSWVLKHAPRSSTRRLHTAGTMRKTLLCRTVAGMAA